MADTIRLNWRKSETHGLEDDPRAARRSVTRCSRPTIISSNRRACSTAGCRRSCSPKRPAVVDTEEGHEVWHFDGKVFFQVGLNAVVGRKREDWKVEPTRFDEMRRGCYDIDARIRDMDINGVWASVNFPSQITGFCGSVFSRCSDPELGLAVTRAWNDWFYDEWYSAVSRADRADGHHVPRRSRARPPSEIRRNAARGFTAVTLPEMPHRIGMEPIFSKWWDPIIAACAETDTVVCLHVGSTGVADMPPGAPMVPLGATLFGQLSLSACAEWLWSAMAGALPEPQDHHERGRHRLGRDVARPAREHRRPLRLRRATSPATCARPKCCTATSGSRRSTTRRRSARAKPSASTTSRSNRTTRTATAPGPTPKHVFAEVFGGLSDDEIAKISHENAAAAVPAPAAAARQPACDRSTPMSEHQDWSRTRALTDASYRGTNVATRHFVASGSAARRHQHEPGE